MYDPLCKLEDVKPWVGAKANDDTQEGVLGDLINACSDLIGQYCGRPNLGMVLPYVENRFQSMTALPKPDYATRIVTNYYPVVGSTLSVLWNSTAVPLLTSAQLQGSQNITGVFLEDDLRTLRFLGMWMPPSYGAVQITYQAGYYLDQTSNPPTGSQPIPPGLKRVCVQFVGEVYKSQSWIGYKSKSLAGETTTYDTGADFGMSPRTKAMLQPYRNRVPLI